MAKTAAPRALFSTDCAPAQKIRSVLEEYRRQHFSRELPSRFKKEMVKAMTTPETSVIHVDTLNLILKNIGRDDARLSEDELALLLQEVGATDRNVSVDKILQLM